MTTHSASYSQAEQMRFVTGWFSGWSTLQRQDFAPALAQKLQARLYVNGLIGGMERLGRPPSIFQCQVKLFQEWVDTWTPEQREQLKSRLVEADAEFGRRLEDALGGAEQPSPADGAASDPEQPEPPTEDASIESQSSELTPTEI